MIISSEQYLSLFESATWLSLGMSTRIPNMFRSSLFSSFSASSLVSAHLSDSFSFVLSIFSPAILHHLFDQIDLIILHRLTAEAQVSISLDFCTKTITFLCSPIAFKKVFPASQLSFSSYLDLMSVISVLFCVLSHI